MTIEKDDNIYTVSENAQSWTVTKAVESVTINAKISKADCPTFESLKAFVAENNIF